MARKKHLPKQMPNSKHRQHIAVSRGKLAPFKLKPTSHGSRPSVPENLCLYGDLYFPHIGKAIAVSRNQIAVLIVAVNQKKLLSPVCQYADLNRLSVIHITIYFFKLTQRCVGDAITLIWFVVILGGNSFNQNVSVFGLSVI